MYTHICYTYTRNGDGVVPYRTNVSATLKSIDNVLEWQKKGGVEFKCKILMIKPETISLDVGMWKNANRSISITLNKT